MSLSIEYHPAHGGYPNRSRICYFCKEPIEAEKAIQAKSRNAWAHFSCWYSGTPIKGKDGRVI